MDDRFRVNMLRQVAPQLLPFRMLTTSELFNAALRVERLAIRPTNRRPDLEMLEFRPRARRAFNVAS